MLAILGNAIWITYLTEAWQIMVQWCCDDSLGCRMPVHPTAKDWSLKHPLDANPTEFWYVDTGFIDPRLGFGASDSSDGVGCVETLIIWLVVWNIFFHRLGIIIRIG